MPVLTLWMIRADYNDVSVAATQEYRIA